MNDGSIILVEIARGTLSKVTSSGNVEVIVDFRGGPNEHYWADTQVWLSEGFEWEITQSQWE